MAVVRLMSYSIKGGVPEKRPDVPTWRTKNVNIVNRITNPWRIKQLRKLNGKHPDVQAFIRRCKKTKSLLRDLMYYCGAGYDINVGCYGGQHRSVAIVEMLAEMARAQCVSHTFEVVHRDLKEIPDGNNN